MKWTYLTVLALSAAAAPPPVWETPLKLAPAELGPALARNETAAAELPAALGATASFQRLLLRIRSGAPVAEWRGELAKVSTNPASDPVSVGLRELALAWEARARMTEVDVTLRQFYRHNVRFPDKLDEVKAAIPASAQTDPWGDAWTYAPTAPKNFSAKFAKQRYTLLPSKHPTVRPLEDTLEAPPAARTWKITPRDIAGQKVLEFRLASGQQIVTQPGGHIEDATLLHIGEGWALLADLERLFTAVW